MDLSDTHVCACRDVSDLVWYDHDFCYLLYRFHWGPPFINYTKIFTYLLLWLSLLRRSMWCSWVFFLPFLPQGFQRFERHTKLIGIRPAARRQSVREFDLPGRRVVRLIPNTVGQGVGQPANHLIVAQMQGLRSDDRFGAFNTIRVHSGNVEVLQNGHGLRSPPEHIDTAPLLFGQLFGCDLDR